MIAISGDDAIFLRDRGLHADGDGLLAVVQVAKPADQFGLVERVGGDLHAAHRRHVAEEGEELRRRGLHGARRRFAFVGGEWNGGLDREGSGVVGRELAAEIWEDEGGDRAEEIGARG